MVIAAQTLTWSGGFLFDASVRRSEVVLRGLFSLTFFSQRASISLPGRCRLVRRVFKFIQPAIVRGSLGGGWLRLSFCPEITCYTQNAKAHNDSQDIFHAVSILTDPSGPVLPLFAVVLSAETYKGEQMSAPPRICLLRLFSGAAQSDG